MSAEKLKILVVEDSKFFSEAIRHKLGEIDALESIYAATYQEAEAIIAQQGHDFFVALLDLCLPDAREGEIVRLMHKHDIPSIIFSSKFDRENLDRYYDMGVIDCVAKNSPASLDYFISLVKRLLLNRMINVLVVEDSITARKMLCAQLLRQQINVMEAGDGKEAMTLLDGALPVHMVLTDYHMPNMDGFELTRKLRAKYSKDQLPIIGMTSNEDAEYAVLFLKLGANDFIHKPFSYEELLCRVSQNLDIYCLIEDLKKTVYRDELTGLNNRRYLLEYGTRLFDQAEKPPEDLTVALIDIDHFKNINDSYGHHMGDDILRKVSENLQQHIVGKDILARIGGEEFCVILHDKAVEKTMDILDKLRLAVAEGSISICEEDISVTVSIGVCTHQKDDFETMLKAADIALYEAKNQGRNCLKLAETETF